MRKALHCTECGGLAALHQYPHKFAGIWECENAQCGASGSCEHESTHVESVTTDYMRNGEHDQYETEVYVCDACNCTIPPDEADPAIDRTDALADMQIMQALGK